MLQQACYSQFNCRQKLLPPYSTVSPLLRTQHRGGGLEDEALLCTAQRWDLLKDHRPGPLSASHPSPASTVQSWGPFSPDYTAHTLTTSSGQGRARGETGMWTHFKPLWGEIRPVWCRRWSPTLALIPTLSLLGHLTMSTTWLHRTSRSVMGMQWSDRAYLLLACVHADSCMSRQSSSMYMCCMSVCLCVCRQHC